MYAQSKLTLLNKDNLILYIIRMSKFATYMFLHAFLLVWNFKYVVADEAN